VTAFLSLHTGSGDAQTDRVTKISSDGGDADRQGCLIALSRC